MKRFLISSPNFTGEIRVVYSPDWKILGVDFTGCDLTTKQAEYFLQKVPVQYTKALWDAAFEKAKLSIVIEGVKIEFEDFWEAYGLKRDRIRCEKIWNRMSESEKAKCMHGYSLYAEYLKVNKWQSKAYPEKFLRNKYWENDWKTNA